jgi:transposase
MPFVCVQPMQTSWARRSEDLTFDKTNDKDAILIARLTAQLTTRAALADPVGPGACNRERFSRV